MARIPFLLALLQALCCSVECFQSHTGKRARLVLKYALPPAGDYSSEATQKAMLAARNCAASGLSPGAGLATAEEQAEAAYADMINTSIDQKGISLSETELLDLNRGGQMWEKGAITEESKFGILSDLSNLWKALSGGAHIVKNEFGET